MTTGDDVPDRSLSHRFFDNLEQFFLQNQKSFPTDPESPGFEESQMILDWIVTLERILRSLTKGKLTTEAANELRAYTSRLCGIIERCLADDETSLACLEVIERLSMSDIYGMSVDDFDAIEKIIRKDRNDGSLARGWEMRHLMSSLSSVLIPALPDQFSLLDGPVRLNTTQQGHSIYRTASKPEYWTSQTTLESLVVNAYTDQLIERGFDLIDPSTLYADLRAVKKWQESLSEEEKRNTDKLPIFGGIRTEWVYFRRYRFGWVRRRRT